MDIAAIFQDPRLMLFGLDSGVARFVPMTRESYARSIFFDRRLQPAGQQFTQVPLQALLAHLDETGFVPPRIRFIHHFAHSGSTLLARALEHPENLIIREPAHLRQLGVSAGAGIPDVVPPHLRAPLALSLTMLGKRFTQDSTVIVKGNVPISLLAEAIAQADPGQPAILLYFPLEDYCAAVLRTPGHQSWVERVTHDIALNRDPLVGDIGGLTTAEKAAALWYSMIKRFERLLAQHPNMRSLDANQLFDRPAETIAAASDLLGAGLDAHFAEAVANGPLLSSYSKNPNLPFDNSVRRQLGEKAKSLLADELLAARRWVEKRAADSQVPEALDRPLIRKSAPLL
jgi:hypothetical protein